MSETNKCHKCGCTDKKLIHHHKSYDPEIIVMVCMPCHKLLHNRLRKNGQCDISPDKLAKLSQKSEHQRKLKNKLTREYYRLYRSCWNFNDTMMPNIRLVEQIIINTNKNRISFNSYFQAYNKKNIFYIDIV